MRQGAHASGAGGNPGSNQPHHLETTATAQSLANYSSPYPPTIATTDIIDTNNASVPGSAGQTNVSASSEGTPTALKALQQQLIVAHQATIAAQAETIRAPRESSTTVASPTVPTNEGKTYPLNSPPPFHLTMRSIPTTYVKYTTIPSDPLNFLSLTPVVELTGSSTTTASMSQNRVRFELEALAPALKISAKIQKFGMSHLPHTRQFWPP
ncbi:hypothetical protein K3495_g8610 [Podosphaera aphanis]|nr:hypothetical protein K3495_g8610 [Podosphaera aphanis]